MASVRRTATRMYRPILSIDTSSSQGGIALYDGRRLSTRSWPAERSHTTTLLSEIHHLLDRAEIRVRELAAVAIATGPGAFTGLRVGFGVAKGFHLATGVPLIGDLRHSRPPRSVLPRCATHDRRGHWRRQGSVGLGPL